MEQEGVVEDVEGAVEVVEAVEGEDVGVACGYGVVWAADSK